MAGLISFCAALAAAAFSPAADVPDSRWDGPSTYYNGVIQGGMQLQGTDLRSKLCDIISTGVQSVLYDTEKLTMPTTDRVYSATGTGTTQMWGVYDRVLLPGTYNSTWNREHVWPQSKLGNNSDHDMFGLRPALVASNGDRANFGYGGVVGTTYSGVVHSGPNKGQPSTVTVTDTTAAGNLPRLPGKTYPLFYAGPYDKGDVARACFYMATRYYVASAPNSVNSLKIVNTYGEGDNPDGTMGDLNSMLHWHYQDPVDNFERRRNQYIYNNPELIDVPTGSNKILYSQKNRNPYVDHPEYVWSVFGGGANDSQISVATAVNGASSKAVSFGRVIVGGTAPTLSTTVNVTKTGADPTTFNVTTSGAATTDMAGNLNTFDYAAGSKMMKVGLAGVTTTTAGLRTGTVTIDNTDLTTDTAVAGSGANDGNDTVDLSLAVLDHANASFAKTADADYLYLNFQNVNRGSTASLSFGLTNLLAASGYTAGLDLDSITGTGDTGAFATGLATLAALDGGVTNNYLATFTPDRNGVFMATYTLAVSDENISGATAGNSLTLVLSGVSNARAVPEPLLLGGLPVLAVLLRRRSRAPDA